jgi:hypothetical protein
LSVPLLRPSNKEQKIRTVSRLLRTQTTHATPPKPAINSSAKNPGNAGKHCTPAAPATTPKQNERPVMSFS